MNFPVAVKSGKHRTKTLSETLSSVPVWSDSLGNCDGVHIRCQVYPTGETLQRLCEDPGGVSA